MNLQTLFNKLINGEQIRFEDFAPYKKSLKTLLRDYYCGEVVTLQADILSPYFWIPINNEYNEDKYFLSLEDEDEEENFLSTCLGILDNI